MSKIRDQLFTYQDECCGTVSRFRLRVFQSSCAFTVAVATEMPRNPGVRVDFIDAHMPVTFGNLVGLNAAVYEAIGLECDDFVFLAHLPTFPARRSGDGSTRRRKNDRFFLRCASVRLEAVSVLDYLRECMLSRRCSVLPIPGAFVAWLLGPLSTAE